MTGPADPGIDLGVDLAQVTFVVLDLETTGMSPSTSAITEIGAVKFRGGQCLGHLQTLVNPGQAIPPDIVYFTGITQMMVGPAPSVAAVLPALLEFIGPAVIVGHNVAFDLRFLRAALGAEGYPPLTNHTVDTCWLARRLLMDEVTDHRLATLARFFRTESPPTHRALDDARATGEVLHGLLERAGTLSVLTLDDLLDVPTLRDRPDSSRLRLSVRVPPERGVFVLGDDRGRALLVGRATNLRRRVRAYLTGSLGKRVRPHPREVASVQHIQCDNDLEATVLAMRLTRQLTPCYNPAPGPVYVRLCVGDANSKLSIVAADQLPRSANGDLYLGPISSPRVASDVIEAIRSVVPIGRGAATSRRGQPPAPCPPGAARRRVTGNQQAAERVALGLTVQPASLLGPLAGQIRQSILANRYEDAAVTRRRAQALAGAIEQRRRLEALRNVGALTVDVGGSAPVVLDGGRYVGALGGIGGGGPTSAEHEEVACVAGWLEDHTDELYLVNGGAGLACPGQRLPTFVPGDRLDRGQAGTPGPD